MYIKSELSEKIAKRSSMSRFFCTIFRMNILIFSLFTNLFSYAEEVNIWTFNMGGNISTLTKNYNLFLQQVSILPDFIGCQEAITSADNRFLDALRKKSMEQGSAVFYELIQGKPRGGIPDSGENERCSIFYDSNKWIREVGLEESLGSTLYQNMANQLMENWNLVLTNEIKSKLQNQSAVTFQLTLRVSNAHNNIGGPFKDRKDPYGPFSRIATWAIFTSKITGSQVLVVDAHLCRKMNELDPGQREILYDELVNNLINTYRAAFPNSNAILIGDMNDNNCFNNINKVKSTIPISWQIGAGPSVVPINEPKGLLDWILFSSPSGTFTAKTSHCFTANTRQTGDVSDHPCVKQATLNLN